tara:strand:- start:9004 stop:9513 length:510 start_codon:yes stop_codon:yes gene_type:complete
MQEWLIAVAAEFDADVVNAARLQTSKRLAIGGSRSEFAGLAGGFLSVRWADPRSTMSVVGRRKSMVRRVCSCKESVAGWHEELIRCVNDARDTEGLSRTGRQPTSVGFTPRFGQPHAVPRESAAFNVATRHFQTSPGASWTTSILEEIKYYSSTNGTITVDMQTSNHAM